MRDRLRKRRLLKEHNLKWANRRCLLYENQQERRRRHGPKEVHRHSFQFERSYLRAGRGQGQRHSIARSVIVDKHDGEIGFETEVGKGTTVTIQLPWLWENKDMQKERSPIRR